MSRLNWDRARTNPRGYEQVAWSRREQRQLGAGVDAAIYESLRLERELMEAAKANRPRRRWAKAQGADESWRRQQERRTAGMLRAPRPDVNGAWFQLRFGRLVACGVDPTYGLGRR